MPAHDGDVKAAKAGLCFPERPPLLIRFPIGRIRPVSIAALVPLDAAPPVRKSGPPRCVPSTVPVGATSWVDGPGGPVGSDLYKGRARESPSRTGRPFRMGAKKDTASVMLWRRTAYGAARHDRRADGTPSSYRGAANPPCTDLRARSRPIRWTTSTTDSPGDGRQMTELDERSSPWPQS